MNSTNSLTPLLRRTSRWCNRAFLLGATLALGTALQAQVATIYGFTQSPGAYTPITGGTVLVSGTFDNTVFPVAGLPSFTYNLIAYTALNVSTNGFLTFGATPPSATSFVPISSTTAYAGAVSALGRDLTNSVVGGAAPEIRWEVVGSEIVVQWKDVSRATQGDQLNFQIRLNTTTNQINVVYGPMTLGTGNSSVHPQVGLRGPTNAFATNVNNRTVPFAPLRNWANSLPGTANGSVSRLAGVDVSGGGPVPPPVSGQTYTWSVQTCTKPTFTFTSNPSDCLLRTHMVGITLTSLGSAATVNIYSQDGNAAPVLWFSGVSALALYNLGPFPMGSALDVYVQNAAVPDCDAHLHTIFGTSTPCYDVCANAFPITCAMSPFVVTTVGATIDAEYTNCGAGGTAGSQTGVWLKYVGDNQQVTLDFCAPTGLSWDSRLTVYTGTCGGPWTCVTANDDMPNFPAAGSCTYANFRSKVVFNAFSGTDYYIFVHSFSTAGTGLMNMACAPLCLPIPGNDACAGATPLTVDAAPTAGFNTCAAAPGTNPSCFSGFATLPDVWYSFVANGTTNTLVITNGTAVGTGYAVYSSCGGTQLLCNNTYVSGSPAALTGLTNGVTYWVQVLTDVALTGSFTVQVLTPCAAPTGTATVVSANCGEYSLQVNVTGTGNSPGSVVDIQVDGVDVQNNAPVGGPYGPFGPYLNGSSHTVTLEHLSAPLCNLVMAPSTSNITCNDGNPATSDACVLNACVFTPIPCDDGNPCTTGDVLVAVNTTENFDGVVAPALPAGWTTAGSGTANPFVTTGTFFTSGPNSAFCADFSTPSDWNLSSPSIPIVSASAVVTFRNKFITENTFDGGVLEISINGGAFVDIITAGGSFVIGGYTGVISTGFGSPIGGQNAWTGTNAGSPAFITTTVTLPASAAGFPVVLRWRFVSDTSASGSGWWIDDIVVTDVVCQGTPLPDTDGDLACDLVDTDDDNDGVLDGPDTADLDPDQCEDADGDGCDDCSVGTDNFGPMADNTPANDGTDTDSDGLCDSGDVCPTVANGNPGDACNDGNNFTFNDVLGSSPTCSCAGTACTQSVVITIATDGGGLRWTLRNSGNNAVIQSSPGYPAYDFPPVSPNYGVTTCLPNGQFYFTLEDEDCDGIVNGGYTVTVGGKRVIDNTNNMNLGCPSQIAGNTGVNVPVGNDRLISASCDRLDLRRGVSAACSDRLTADNTPNAITPANASVYQFWIFDPNGGTSIFYPSATGVTTNAVSMFALPSLLDNKLYNVRVRTRISPGVFRPWGAACRFMINNTLGQCPVTKLQDEVDNAHLSCGQVRALGSGAQNLIYAKPKVRFGPACGTQVATRYQFRFRIPNEAKVIVKYGVGANPWTYLNNTQNMLPAPMPYTGQVLEACKPYEVEVRASFDGGATWCIGGNAPNDPYTNLAPWGDVCMLYTTLGCFDGGGQHMALEEAGSTLHLYPNPNRGDQVVLNIDEVKEGVNTVSVDIYDTFGKRVSARTIAVQDGFVNTVLELNGELAAGMYLVNITAGDAQYTERLVIQP